MPRVDVYSRRGYTPIGPKCDAMAMENMNSEDAPGRDPAPPTRAGLPLWTILLGGLLPAFIVFAVGLFSGGLSRAAVSAAPAAAPAYVGAASCGGCHATETAAWKTSHHALAMQHATPETVLGDFNDTKFVHGNVTSTFFRRDGKFFVNTDGPDGTMQDFEVKFTFGVKPLQQYLLELPGGRLQALSVAWDTRAKADGGQHWFHMYPDEAIPHDDPLHWTGPQQNWNFMCAECHSTHLERGFDEATDTYKTTYSDINVACESCHGPGSTHEAWAKHETGWEAMANKGLPVALDERNGVTWELDPKTGNSTRSTPRTTTREIETCALCHSRRGPIWADIVAGAPIGDSHRVALLDDGLYFPDGQIHDEVYEYGSFLQSRMFHAGVTCSDCHDPHSLQLRAEGSGVCLQCHSADRYATAEHHHHPIGSAGAECASCHMPQRTYMVVDPRRDHSFRIPRPDRSVALGTPNACNQCHTDKTPAWAAEQVKAWYPTANPGFQTFAEALEDGNIGAPGARDHLFAVALDTSVPAIARASALERLDRLPSQAAVAQLKGLTTDPDPLVRRAAASAYVAAPPTARGDLFALLDDPVRDVRLEAARMLADLPADGLTADQRARRDRGAEEYIASQRSNADRPEAHHNIAVIDVALGRYDDAEAELKKAIAVDPNFLPAAVTLADLYRGMGRDAEGEPILKAAIARQPDAPSGHFAYGLWLVRAGRHEEALAELKLAAMSGGADPRIAYVYAIALSDMGKPGDAIQMLRASLQRHPNDAETLLALAGFEKDAGMIDEARRHAARLAELEPDAPAVQALLLQLGQ